MRYLSMVLLIFAMLPAFAQALPGDGQTAPSLWSRQPLRKADGEFCFAVISDLNGDERPGVFDRAVESLNNLQPAFVMSIGDLIGGYRKDEATLTSQYDAIDARIAKLQMPFHRTPGNHDITYPVAEKLYTQRYGRPYSYFVYDNVLFLTLNTTSSRDDGALDPEQVTFFQQVIASHPNVRWTMLFMHHPIWKVANSNWDKIETAFQGRHYTVFAGHTHIYESAVRHGQHYYILSTTGGGSPLRGVEKGEFDHIVWVTMTNAGPSVTNLLLNGIVKDTIRDEATVKVFDALSDGIAVSCSPVTFIGDQVKNVATQVKMENKTAYPVHLLGHITSALPTTATPEFVDITLQPKEAKNVDLRLQLAGGMPFTREILAATTFGYSVSYTPAQGKPITIKALSAEIPCIQKYRSLTCPRRTKPVVLDGKLDDWTTLPYHGGKAGDNAFRFATAYDENYVYVAVKVDDDDVYAVPGTYTWMQDGLEIRFNANKDPERSQWKGCDLPDEKELIIPVSPGETADKTILLDWGKRPEGTKIVCIKTPSGYNAEIAIPISYFNERQGGKWQAFRFNIAVDDFDNAVRYAYVWWCPDWRGSSTYAGSGTFIRK